ncbi:MAG: hypothetical protein CTY10_07735 [Methylotenera sp.]|nr:MAG: hypothetical protein CTY10_07735 [Methylotenera sp.]
MMKVKAGCEFGLIVVCNGGNEQPLYLPARFQKLNAIVLNRENSGYNIGAWNFGWQSAKSSYSYFMFLQDDCFLKEKNWLYQYQYRLSTDDKLGLLGEVIMWDRMTWHYIRQATDRDLGGDWYDKNQPHPIDFYQNYLASNNIPKGELGSHLQSIILFTSSKILSEIGGFPVGKTYQDAIACEIGISRMIESKGYRISKVDDYPFKLIGHRQWTGKRKLINQIRNKVKGYMRPLLRVIPKSKQH